MLAIRLEDNLLEELDHLAKAKHTSRSQLVREAIIRFLEDQEDYQLAIRTLKNKKAKTFTLAEVRKELDLDN